MTDTAPRPGLRLLDFKPLRKGALIGFATVELPIGLEIRDCPVCMSRGKAWAGLPGKPQLKDDRVIRDERGKLVYSTILDWRERGLRDAFSERVVALVREHDPQAFAGGDGP
jgi:hypothetical protein